MPFPIWGVEGQPGQLGGGSWEKDRRTLVPVSGLIPGTLVASLGPESSFPEGVAPLSLAGPTPSSEWACFFPYLLRSARSS